MLEISKQLSNALKIGASPLICELNLSFCFLSPYGRNAGPSLGYDLFFPFLAGIKILGYALATVLCAASIVLDIFIFLPANILLNVLTLDDDPRNNLFPTAAMK